MLRPRLALQPLSRPCPLCSTSILPVASLGKVLETGHDPPGSSTVWIGCIATRRKYWLCPGGLPLQNRHVYTHTHTVTEQTDKWAPPCLCGSSAYARVTSASSQEPCTRLPLPAPDQGTSHLPQLSGTSPTRHPISLASRVPKLGPSRHHPPTLLDTYFLNQNLPPSGEHRTGRKAPRPLTYPLGLYRVTFLTESLLRPEFMRPPLRG